MAYYIVVLNEKRSKLRQERADVATSIRNHLQDERPPKSALAALECAFDEFPSLQIDDADEQIHRALVLLQASDYIS